MRLTHLVLGCAVAATAAGCVTRNVAPAPAPAHYVISADELQRVTEISLYDAVRRLRPHFLRPRSAHAVGRPALTPLMLYIDGEKMESVEYLHRLSPREVMEVRFYEPQVANTRFARYNNAAGAIAVVLRAQLPDST
jgi:hypothetical protein